jgi:hypothetical protein
MPWPLPASGGAGDLKLAQHCFQKKSQSLLIAPSITGWGNEADEFSQMHEAHNELIRGPSGLRLRINIRRRAGQTNATINHRPKPPVALISCPDAHSINAVVIRPTMKAA